MRVTSHGNPEIPDKDLKQNAGLMILPASLPKPVTRFAEVPIKSNF